MKPHAPLIMWKLPLESDGLKAAIKNLVNLSQQCVDTFNKRVEVIKTGVSGGDISTTQVQ